MDKKLAVYNYKLPHPDIEFSDVTLPRNAKILHVDYHKLTESFRVWALVTRDNEPVTRHFAVVPTGANITEPTDCRIIHHGTIKQQFASMDYYWHVMELERYDGTI